MVCLCAGMCMCDLVPDVLIFTSEAVTALWEGAHLRGSCGKGGTAAPRYWPNCLWVQPIVILGLGVLAQDDNGLSPGLVIHLRRKGFVYVKL